VRDSFSRSLDAVRGAVGAVAPVAGALPGLVRSATPAAGEFFRGLLGLSPAPAAAAPAAAIAPAVAAPATATPAAPQHVGVMPQDVQAAYLSKVFKQPLTMRQLVAATGALQAPVKPAYTHKDELYATASSVADAQYKADLAAAEKAGSDKDTEIRKATDEYFKRQAALLGINNLMQLPTAVPEE